LRGSAGGTGLYVNSSGNVGIGTTSPQGKLHVVQNPPNPSNDYALKVSGDCAGIHVNVNGISTTSNNIPRPFGVVTELNIPSGMRANNGGGFNAELRTSQAGGIPYVLGGLFGVNDDGDKNARALTLYLQNAEANDYGLELKCDDPSYAIYSPGTGKVYFEGNVGIGTTGPGAKLDVVGGGIQTDSYFAFSNVEQVSTTHSVYINAPRPDNFGIFTNKAERVTVDKNGNVGIGTTEPEGILEVAGDLSVAGDAGIIVHNISTVNNNADAIRIVDDATGQIRYRNTVGHQFGVDPSGNPSYYLTNDGSNSYLNANGGNVGIGTTSPGAKLHVEGEVKSVVNGTEFYMVPKGGIIMWSGSIASIPSGWQLCDGTNGTPDLRDRFIVGAGNTYAVGNTGGAETHTHGAGSYRGPNHTHTYSGYTTGVGDVRGNLRTRYHDIIEGTSGFEHYYSGTTGAGGTGPITGTSASASSLPPYYALAFIMKL
jgi:microcystin-dependent protein